MNEVLPFCDNMNGPGGYYTKWNIWMEKDKYHMISLIQKKKKKKTTKPNNQNPLEPKNKQNKTEANS